MCRRLSRYLIRSYFLILSSFAKVAQQVSPLNLTNRGYQKSRKSNLHNFLLERPPKAKMHVRNRYKVPSQVHISATMLLFEMSQKDGHRAAWRREAKQLPMIRSRKLDNSYGMKISHSLKFDHTNVLGATSPPRSKFVKISNYS